MTGSFKGQITALFRVTGMLRFGMSRHLDKKDARKRNFRTAHEVATQTGIYSWSTYNAYVRVGIEFLKYTAREFGIRDAELLKNEHVYAFLLSKSTSERTAATLKTYASGLMKLETALCLYKKSPAGSCFSIGLTTALQYSKSTTRVGYEARAYDEPEALLKFLEATEYLVARLQLECGLRISEATIIKRSELLPSNKLRVPRTKGGRERTVQLSTDLAALLRNHFQNETLQLQSGEGVTPDLVVDRDQYIRALKHACELSGQSWTGSHGLRWSYAQTRILELASEMSYESALQTVSYELGHSRPSISEWYLRR